MTKLYRLCSGKRDVSPNTLKDVIGENTYMLFFMYCPDLHCLPWVIDWSYTDVMRFVKALKGLFEVQSPAIWTQLWKKKNCTHFSHDHLVTDIYGEYLHKSSFRPWFPLKIAPEWSSICTLTSKGRFSFWGYKTLKPVFCFALYILIKCENSVPQTSWMY